MAPEQAIDSRSVDGRADIYSLGCTLYFLLVGSPPYRGATVTQRLAKHQTTAPPDIRQQRPDCPAVLAELAVRMMAKRPEDRIPSASELLSQIKRVRSLLGQSQSAGRTGGSVHSLNQIAPASDTIAEDSGWPTQNDPKGVTDLSSLPAFDTNALFDFGNLPATSAPAVSKTNGASRAFPIATSTLKSLPAPATTRTSFAPAAAPGSVPKGTVASGTTTQSQTLLLGIGLAVAVMALLMVAGFGFYLATRPEKDSRPTIRSVEDGEGSKVIVVKEE